MDMEERFEPLDPLNISQMDEFFEALADGEVEF